MKNIVSLPPTVVFTLSSSLGVVGVRNGMLFVSIAFSLPISNPVAGAALRSGWTCLKAFCGATILISAGVVIAARIARVGLIFKTRA